MQKRKTVCLSVTVVLGALLTGCGGDRDATTIGPPTGTVRQVTEWPEGVEPAGGGYRLVDMPAAAKKHVEDTSAEAGGRQEYFGALRR